MEESDKKLYPVSFEPVTNETAWGSETYGIADLGYIDSAAKGGWLDGNSLSDIMETYLERVVGDKVYYFYGRQFPVTVRLFETKTNTPLTVCPDDEIAEQRYDALGKKKLWYVVDAKPGAELYMGFGRDVSAAELYGGCEDGSVKEMLNIVAPRKGETFVIHPSTAHAAGAGLRILEIAEASGLDFHIYNWGQPLPEEDGLVEVLDYVDMKKYEPRATVQKPHGNRPEDRLMTKLAAEPEFTVTEIHLTDALNISTAEFDSFLLYSCIEGEASIQVPAEKENGEKYMKNFILTKGETMLVPAEVEEFYLAPRDSGTLVMETMVQREEAADAYIDPEAEESLAGEEEKPGTLFS